MKESFPLILSHPLSPHLDTKYICDVNSGIARGAVTFAWYCPRQVTTLAWPSVRLGSAMVQQGRPHPLRDPLYQGEEYYEIVHPKGRGPAVA